MSQITNCKDYFSKKADPKQIFLICGYGGKIWQTKCLIDLLLKNGYDVRAIDYSTDVLKKGNPQLLIDLVHEIHEQAILFRKKVNKPVLLLGISMGALISLNIMRRDRRFFRAVMITGGDIVKVAHRSQGLKIWPQTYDELAIIWKSVNMYTDPAALSHVSGVMVLPVSDRLIDPDDVRKELSLQKAYGNNMQLIEKKIFGHIATIFVETVLFPKRVLGYIDILDQNSSK